MDSVAAIEQRLGATGYLCDDALATVAYLALTMQRPLLLEGEPGTGKTALAEAIAEALELPLVRLQCYEGIDATQALYDWDFPRQILHLRALEAVAGGAADVEEAEKSLYDARFLLARPVLQALQAGAGGAAGRRGRPGRRRVRGVPARGAVDVPGDDPGARHRPGRRARRSSCSPPTAPASCTTRSSGAASTTGSTTPASSARCRSCGRGRPRSARRWPARWSALVQQLRGRDDLLKPPGVAETLDWARALHHLGTDEIDLAAASATLGALVKYREDSDRVKQALDRMLAAMTHSMNRGPDEILLGFGRALRAAGVPVTQDRAHGFLAAVATLGLDDQRATYLAGRATLCAGPDDLERYDQVFEAYFNARDGLPRTRPAHVDAELLRVRAADLRGRHRLRRRGRRGGPGDGQRGRGAPAPRRGRD